MPDAVVNPGEPDQYRQVYAELIETAAHDLDAPLRKLGILVERVTAECEKEQPQNIPGYVSRINRCLSDMRSMIDSLTLLARAGLGAGNQTVFNPEEVIRDAWRELQPAANEKKAQLSVGSLPLISGDRAQCKQLFKHLLQNAVVFAAKDIAPEVTVHAEALSGQEKQSRFAGREGGEYCKITVEDNGIGLSPEDAERIFYPFVRLHGKSEYEGNGIGLALCRKIAENHRGIIYAESREDTGSRFVLIIPQTTN